MTRGSKILGMGLRLLAVCAISALVLGLAFEAYLRHARFLDAEPAPYPCIGGDPVLNHTFQPKCEGMAKAEALKTARDVTYRTNVLGYRGHAPEAGKRSVVVLGDSFTEGFGLEEPETFPASLEAALRAGGAKDWQVLNGGTVGFSPVLYTPYFDRYFLPVRPELVVLNLDLTDFNDEPYFLQIAEYDPTGRPVAFPGRDFLPGWAQSFLYTHKSAVLRFIHDEINQWGSVHQRENMKWRLDQWIKADRPLIDPADLKAAGLEDCAKPAEAVAKDILLLRDHVAGAGGRLAIHMYPPGAFVKSYANLPQTISFVRSWDQKNRQDYSWHCNSSDKIVGVMKAFAKREGMPFFDSFPVIAARDDKKDLYFDRDAHWNEKGVKVVTEALAPLLKPLLSGSGSGSGKKGK